MDLRSRVMIITGASHGIGRALARRLAREGARLVLVARSESELRAVAREAEGSGCPEALVAPGDVTEPDTARRAVRLAVDRFSGLDALVNNAGVGLRAPVTRIDPGDLAYVFGVNVIGALNFTREVVPHLVRRGEGLIVNLASVAARQAIPLLGGYAATKAAVVALSDALRLELRGTGVRVLAVFPGSVETGFKAQARGEPYPERRGASRLSPEMVAEAIVRAMRSGRREALVLSRSERTGLLLGTVLPGLVEKALVKRYGGTSSEGAGAKPEP